MDDGNAPRLHVAVGRQIRLSSLGSDEASHWRQLTEMIRALTRVEETGALLHYFLTATLELLEADRGHIRLLDAAAGQYELRTQLGFDELPGEQLEVLGRSPIHERALRAHGRIVIEDLESSALLQGHPCLQVLRAARCRAVQATPLARPSGQILGVLTTYHEVPHRPGALQLRLLDALCLQASELLERAWEKEALLEAARRKDEFLATLAHELRNAIAPLRSSLEILKLARLEDPLQVRARAILDRRLDHTTRLIDDLMDASRIARGKLQLHSQRVAFASVLESAVETVASTLKELDHELTVSLPERDLTIEGDPVRLAQVFVNLLYNAAKYTPAGGHIHLRTTQQGGGVQVEVQDNGIGITPEALPHLFEMFSQASLGESRRRGGLGIGLALVKGVIDMHGGSIAVTSPGRDLGSTFTVWLPVMPAGEGRQPVPDIASLTRCGSEPLRVLVVDDDIDAAESLAGLLALHGHATLVAHDGLEAIEATSKFHPDLILLDLMMPRMGGLEAAERIRQLPLPHQPEIVELTGHTYRSDPQRESAASIGVHLLKPVELTTIQEVVAITARNINLARETGVQLLINNIDLALTLLSNACISGDDAKRARSLGNARRAYHRATALLKRLTLDSQQMQSIEEGLQRLEAELTAAGEPI